MRCASIGIIHWVKISNSMRGRWVDRLNSRRKECSDMLCNALALVINFGAKWMDDLEINMVFVLN